MKPAVSREWMTLNEIVQYAGVSERTVREWIKLATNPLPASKVGNKLLISRSRFDAWLESHSISGEGSINITALVDDVMSGIGGR